MCKEEIDQIKFLIEAKYSKYPENSQELINERAATCLKWYIGKACFYKNMFYTCSLLALFCPLVSSVLVGFSSLQGYAKIIVQIIIVSLGVISSASTGILALFHAQEKWTNYRTASEFLKREIALYKAGADKYNGKEENAHLLFLKTIEEYMMKENLEWKNTQKPETNPENGDTP